MKTSSKRNLETELVRLAEAFPLAKGSLTATHSPCTRKNCKLCAEGKGHAKLIFTYRDDGKLKGLYVRPEHEKLIRLAIENGRKVERFLAGNGRSLVLSLRGGDDAE
jgi:hypothetical protein